MKITQLAEALNGTLLTTGIIDQVTGEAAVAKEDLSNIVDIGTAVLDYTGQNNTNYDSFIRSLIDQVGRIMLVDRKYSSQAPNILMDSWEYGSVLEKVRCEVPDARDNATWDLFNYPQGGGGDAYPDPFTLSKPASKAKFYNSKATYEVPITIAEKQLKEAFQSPAQLSSFVSMIENRIRMKMTLCNDALIMATINNLIAQKIAKGHVVNLLSEYKKIFTSSTTTEDTALTDKEFLRFASKTIAQYKKYLAVASTLYNESTDAGNPNASGGYITFTPADKLKFIANTEFSKSLDAYLYSDTYHNEFVNLPGYEEVAFWQGTGVLGDSDRLLIDVKIDDGSESGFEVIQDGVVAVMFDRDACAVCNQNYRTTSIYNPRGEYFNYFYKFDAMYMNDILENVVVFIVSDYTYLNQLPATKPDDWDTKYAIASSPYYINISGTLTQLSASDKSTAQGFDWDDYKGKELYIAAGN